MIISSGQVLTYAPVLCDIQIGYKEPAFGNIGEADRKKIKIDVWMSQSNTNVSLYEHHVVLFVRNHMFAHIHCVRRIMIYWN